MADSITKIATDAALGTAGISGICFPGVLRIPKDLNKSDLEIYLSVNYGFNIPELVWNVQKEVAKKLNENGVDYISKINIHVENIIFEETK